MSRRPPRTALRAADSAKVATGIHGLDVATGGGLPRGRTTLVEGGPGAGKTVLALQALVHGAGALGEPAIFVAFEESSARIVANAAAFGWDLASLAQERLFFLDAQPPFDLVQSGGLDLGGLLAGLDAKVREIGARRIAFDALDVVLALLPDAAAERRELYRLQAWLLERGLTAIVTCKSGPAGSGRQAAGFLQFMVDCALLLDHRVAQGVSQRSLRIQKYRGSAFQENESALVIGAGGIELASIGSADRPAAEVTGERVSSGVARLDTMLGGGYFRGASVLLTGAPGTAKTSLCGAFALAACRRGEPTLFVSFDSPVDEVVRNMRSIGVSLQPHLGTGRQPGPLRMVYLRAMLGSAETQLLQIRALARAHGARCVVVDPVSALSKSGVGELGHGVAVRLIDWAKTEGVTLVCSSLLDHATPDREGSPLEISTIADTWIHLNYVVHAGERNRGLSIVKSRGTAHSNQVRELVLSADGVTLADAYTAGGEVLMGTLRWERERADEREREAAEQAEQLARLRLRAEEAELAARLAELQRQIEARRGDLQVLDRDAAARRGAAAGEQAVRRRHRGADAADPAPAAPRRKRA